ncbi:SMI1/KNR4 family protein [Deinococcus koreensis]|uniref:SMI1/KNR4 family protein n=1 Tax=Deinococcus koreensis TaxID=2054903 RepID=A0A2K3V2L5_9DEIO|nr:SMI1/KNR4 family protein [Deinococcus koreensis]PNY83037.1 SMI1/KNR4 family protein [Deinococcus koreensis]
MIEAGKGFWAAALEQYQEKYSGGTLTPEKVREVEAELGYRLPAGYIAISEIQNGGFPVNICYPTDQQNNWADDHVAIVGIFGIGRENQWTLCGELGSQFWVDEWDYPEIGVYFADCPTAGHQMVALDYRECGPQGEPKVVYVDQEDDYSIIELAPDFMTFITGLLPEEHFEADDG